MIKLIALALACATWITVVLTGVHFWLAHKPGESAVKFQIIAQHMRSRRRVTLIIEAATAEAALQSVAAELEAADYYAVSVRPA